MNQLPKILTLLFATLLTSIVLAQDPPKSRAQAEALAASLKYQQGTIDLRHGLASLQVPGQFRFLNGTDANTVLVRLWGNTPQTEPLGMVVPANTSPLRSAVNFNSGNRYADFNPASGDKVASYGIAALVAGGVAAKLGFFKGLWVLILGAKKFIIIGIAAVAAWFRKLFGKKSTTAG